jgi:ubiquinone/menaquinone biosynthesis C-methylase UbiE
VRFVFGNGLNLPFEDASFDFVHSSAVLEHVGSYANQSRFISECARVARKGFFLTTPNRWFPVEFHTQLPLVHWLPKQQARKVFKTLGLEFFADEANLNLMSRGQLKAIARKLEGFRIDVRDHKLLGWPSNLLLVGKRLAH